MLLVIVLVDTTISVNKTWVLISPMSQIHIAVLTY